MSNVEASNTTTLASAGASLRAMLDGLRARARRILVIRALATLVACVIGGVLALGLLDYLLRLPSPVRMVLLAAGLVGLVWMVRVWVLRAMGFAPSLTSVALRVEESSQGGAVRSLLASALELSDVSQGLAGSMKSAGSAGREDDDIAMRTAVARSAVQAMDGVRPERLLRTEPARHGLITLGAVALLAIVPALLAPTMASTALARVLTPWSGVKWPLRTMVSGATTASVHPAGEALMVRALLTKTNRPLGETPVEIRYRIVREEQAAEPWKTLALSPQMREETVGDQVGEVYERLIDTPALERDARLEYRFITRDDQTTQETVLLTPRPAITTVRMDATPPPYAELAGISGVLSGQGIELDLGSRVAAPLLPVLAGSQVRLTLGFNKEIPASDSAVIAAEYLGEPSLAEFITRTDDGRSWTIDMRAQEALLLEVSPVDEHGLSPSVARMIRLDVIRDEPPAVAIVEPTRDEAVLPTAVVAVQGEARDDVGLRSLVLVRQHARAPAGSEGAPVEAIAEPVEFASIDVQGRVASTVDASLDLANLNGQRGGPQAELASGAQQLLPGDELWVYALAADVYELDGEQRDPTRSQLRRLRIIDASELEAQVRGELSAIRRSAMRLDEQQRALSESIDQQESAEPVDPLAQGRQEALSRRLEAQQQALERLGDRLARNAMEDSPLAGLLNDASELAQEATDASDRAQEALEANQESSQQAAQEAQEQTLQEARKEQDEVRSALADLIASLDRGEDAWVARRSVEQLLEEERRIAAATSELGERTAGRGLDQLTPAELSELERILQEEAARRAREALEELDRRADQLQGRDPAQASALRDAASRGRTAQLEEKLNEASEQISQNRTGEAGGNQQAAIEALEQMLNELENAESRRDEVLRRVLASLIESIESLIDQQEEQLALLEAAGEDLSRLDQGMIRVNTNTLAVIELAREAPGETQTLLAMLEKAERAQAAAVDSLRVDDKTLARRQESASLTELKKAKKEAERLDEEARQREQDRRLQELREAYRDILELQVVLQAETDPFVGQELDRRSRAQVRALGEQQNTLGEQIEALRAQHTDLEETIVFTLAHDRMEAASAQAADSLQRGTADRSVQRAQNTTARLLRSLIEALADAKPPEEEFGEGAGGGGGGGGGGSGERPLVPPLAELKMLRAMQIEAAEWTRMIAEGQSDSGELDQLSVLQNELAERGQKLVEQLQQQQPPAVPGGPIPPDGPTPPVEPAPPVEPTPQGPMISQTSVGVQDGGMQ
jgi:hypothetical protein